MKQLHHQPYVNFMKCADEANYNLNTLAIILNIGKKRLTNAINGRSDFTPYQMILVKKLFRRTIDEIFFYPLL